MIFASFQAFKNLNCFQLFYMTILYVDINIKMIFNIFSEFLVIVTFNLLKKNLLKNLSNNFLSQAN